MPLRSVLVFLFGFILGLRLTEFWPVTVPLAWIMLGLCLPLGWIRRWPVWMIAGLLVGWAWGSIWFQHQVSTIPPGNIVFEGTVFRQAGQQLYLGEISNSALESDVDLGYLSSVTGVRLTVSCQIEKNRQAGRALAHHRQYRCIDPVILHSSARPTTWRGWLAHWRAKVTDRFRATFRSDASALAVGLLYGDNGYFSNRFRSAMQTTGTTHITALSGFNVTIILTLMLNTLRQRIGRKASLVVAGLIVSLFIIMTGAAASIVRAALMSLAVHAAELLGRPVQPLRPLGYAALLIMLANPALVWHDLGFQLSVTSTLGLILFQPKLNTVLSGIPNILNLRENAASTMAATIATLPLLLVTFHRLSLVAIPLNTVVLPFVPIGMGLGGLSLVGLEIFPPLMAVVRPLTELLLTTMTRLIEYAASFHFSSLTLAPQFSILLGLTLFVVIVVHFWYATPDHRT